MAGGTVRSNYSKADSFVRLIKVFALAKGDMGEAEFASQQYERSEPEIRAYFKTAISAGSLGDLNWGGALTPYQSILGEFLELVNAASVLGRMTAARRIPLRAHVAVEVSSGGASWAAEGTAVPVSALHFESAGLLQPRTATRIVILTSDLLKMSRAEAALKQLLVRSVQSYIDGSFLDPSFAASSDSPTSITNQATIVAPTGSTALLVKADLKSMAIAVASGTNEMVMPMFIMSALTAAKLALMSDTAGAVAFPNVHAVLGGTLGGIPVAISAAALGAGSPTEPQIVLVDQASLIIADDDEVRVSVATDATVEMESVPDNPTDAGTVLVSLWQKNWVGLKVSRSINWSMARPHGVASLRVTF